MGMARLPAMVHHAKQIIRRRSTSASASTGQDVPRGHFAVYVGIEGEEQKRFVVPISYLNHPLFQALLHQAEEEFGIEHRMGALTIPCAQDEFVNVTSRLSRFL